MNKIFLLGRLTRDVELKHGQNIDVARCGIAVDRPFSKNKETDFFNVVAFGKTAEFFKKYFAKGSKLAVEGRLQSSTYDKGGKKRSSVDVIIEQLEFADSKKKLPDTFAGEDIDDSDTPF